MIIIFLIKMHAQTLLFCLFMVKSVNTQLDVYFKSTVPSHTQTEKKVSIIKIMTKQPVSKYTHQTI